MPLSTYTRRQCASPVHHNYPPSLISCQQHLKQPPDPCEGKLELKLVDESFTEVWALITGPDMRLLPSDGKRVLIKQPHHSISGSCLKNDITFYFQSDAVGRKCAAPGSLNFPKNIAFFHWPLDKLIFLTNKKICIHFSVHEVVCFNLNI